MIYWDSNLGEKSAFKYYLGGFCESPNDAPFFYWVLAANAIRYTYGNSVKIPQKTYNYQHSLPFNYFILI